MEENAELCKFTREIIEFRKRHPILAGPPDENVSVEWCAESGHTLNPDSKALALVMRPARGEHILVLFNAATITENFKIPAAPGCSWRLALQTSSARPIECCADTGIDIPAVSLAVFVA
jgi:pullulanase/glycogen debranching enzyme